MRTATDFTDIWLIRKVVLFRFSGTRKTTLNENYLKLCVFEEFYSESDLHLTSQKTLSVYFGVRNMCFPN
jgi:hypothetical protein